MATALTAEGNGDARRGEARDFRIAIIGAGFGGLGTAMRLRQRGEEDFVVLERASDVGGTWRDNTYPGCACDVQSHLYSFSFAPNPDWTENFSRQPEIWDYLRRCARDFRLLPHIRFRHEVAEAAWDEPSRRWRIETSGGRYTAAALVLASGALSEPSLPDLPGLTTFRGKVFHSARWDHEYDLAGRRVAVVGTGASAIQFVPEIQPRVGKLDIYQRTPPWILPRRDRALGHAKRKFYRRFPAAQRAVRASVYLFRELFLLGFRHLWLARKIETVARRHLERSVPDPALRAKLTPDYRIGCKRILISNDYLPAVTRPNVEIITGGIAEVRGHSILDRAGVERPADAIIFGTGFQVTAPPLARRVRGRGGRTLSELWAGSPRAYAGTTVAGFPSLFILMGPNTGLGHNSVVYMIEAQIEHTLAALDLVRRLGAVSIEPRPEAQTAFVSEVQKRMEGTVWIAGGCASWYLDSTGRNSTLWPDFSWRFRRRVARLNPDEYVLNYAHAAAPAEAYPAGGRSGQSVMTAAEAAGEL
ncbi:MAG TPA: NAD(P)/FAD-dependent oxidoreductase [Pyrinomonadaceae bacterium]|nr:NAD(P)/FAD-dependent oxidoreductase [Pyrinomonadaceae bacterium]